MDYITRIGNVQVLVDSNGEIIEEVVTLVDRRYDWKERRERNVYLYELYNKAGYSKYADRVRNCATFLEFARPEGAAESERKLKTANFCKMRLCPMCISRRAKKNAWKLSQVLDLVESEHDVKFIFLTLTIQNVDGKRLGVALGELTKAWDRFLDQRQIKRSVRGWFRAIEITRGDNKWHKNKSTGEKEFWADNGYHPHIHAILVVDADYFSKASRQGGKYLNQSDLIIRWQKALRVDYKPSVSIETTKGKWKNGGRESATVAAAKEGAKYPVKDDDYIDPKLPEERAIEILKDYTEALRRRRLTAFGGWMKEAAKKLDAEDLDDGGDLVHVDDDDKIREDVKLLIERFFWHFGAGDYILADREISVPMERGKNGKKQKTKGIQ